MAQSVQKAQFSGRSQLLKKFPVKLTTHLRLVVPLELEHCITSFPETILVCRQWKKIIVFDSFK